jgi:hypothetical protein
MNPTDKIEERTREFEVETNAGKDKAILESLLAAQKQSQCRTPTFGRIAVKAGIIGVAAGIIIISVIWLPGTHEKNTLPPAGSGNTTASGLPSEMITAMSLNRAFYRGGMEAVEKQFEQDEKKSTLKSFEQITTKQLMCELSGDS